MANGSISLGVVLAPLGLTASRPSAGPSGTVVPLQRELVPNANEKSGPGVRIGRAPMWQNREDWDDGEDGLWSSK